MRLAGMREPGSGSGRPATGQRAESAGVSWKPKRPPRLARRAAAEACRAESALSAGAADVPPLSGTPALSGGGSGAGRGDLHLGRLDRPRLPYLGGSDSGRLGGGESRGAESCPAARSGGWPQAAASHARGIRRRIGVMAVDRSRNRGAPQARGVTPRPRELPVVHPESVSSDTIAPISASCMSHCVSHGSPWVPRKSVAAEPLASAVQNSISS